MAKIFEFIRKKKFMLLFIGILALAFVAFFLQNKPTQDESPVFVVKPELPDTQNALVLLSSTVINGDVLDSPIFDIDFYFSKEIDVSSVKASVVPSIPVAVDYIGEKKSRIKVYPKESSWKNDVSYMLTLSGIKGLDGSFLQEDIVIQFKLVTPSDESSKGF
ncbi:MAG: hypothetical protein ACD_22C00078G0003 [uncultured bacterium]|nr:MAG: hypothetical protein ACD_22C00078G0003 [uncultured bacterium]